MIYLGQPGRMIGIQCPTQQRVGSSDRYSFATTLGGEVKAQAGPKTRRTWDVSLGALTTPAEVGALMDFANGSWGPGPFHFLPADAPVVNMLTQDAAACHPGVVQGQVIGSPPMPLGDDGYAARSIWKRPDAPVHLPPVPVIPGHPCTASAWVIGAGFIRLDFLTATGAVVSSHESFLGRDVPTRIHVTAHPTDEAVVARITFTSSITQAARPAITMTPQPYEWGDGQGCAKTIVHATTREITKAWDHPSTGRWSNLSFTIQEVG